MSFGTWYWWDYIVYLQSRSSPSPTLSCQIEVFESGDQFLPLHLGHCLSLSRTEQAQSASLNLYLYRPSDRSLVQTCHMSSNSCSRCITRIVYTYPFGCRMSAVTVLSIGLLLASADDIQRANRSHMRDVTANNKRIEEQLCDRQSWIEKELFDLFASCRVKLPHVCSCVQRLPAYFCTTCTAGGASLPSPAVVVCVCACCRLQAAPNGRHSCPHRAPQPESVR